MLAQMRILFLVKNVKTVFCPTISSLGLLHSHLSPCVPTSVTFSTSAIYSAADHDISSENHMNQRIKKKYFSPELSGSDSDSTESSSTEGSWRTIPSIPYSHFDSSNSRIIYDVTEEELGLSDECLQPIPTQPAVLQDTVPPISLERGKRGVFELAELVLLLKLDKAKDLVVIQIPREVHFVEYMVIASGVAQVHLNNMADTVRKFYNKKMSKNDKGLTLEGRYSEWVAMDLGNIALHIMSPAERKRVDIESLWLCGPENDLKIKENEQPEEEDDIFSLAAPLPKSVYEEQPYDISKEYSHPFHPVSEEEVLPDLDEVPEEQINTYTATSIMEMALRKHNKEYSRKFRGRFRK